MANHYRVSPKFWIKARHRGWSDQQTTLALYLLTCEHRNLEGLYRLPKPYIGADLGWPARKVEETLGVVCTSGFAAYDEDAEMVLIPKALKHQAPSTDKQVVGAVAQLRRIPRTSLWNAFRMACVSHCPKLADAIAKEWPSDSNGASHAHEAARECAPAGPSSSSSSKTLTPFADDFESWVLHYEQTTGHSLPARTTKAFKSVAESYAARRAEGYPADDLLLATAGAHADEYRREHGYDVAESILRPTKIASLIAKGKIRSGNGRQASKSSLELAREMRGESA